MTTTTTSTTGITCTTTAQAATVVIEFSHIFVRFIARGQIYDTFAGIMGTKGDNSFDNLYRYNI